MPLQLVACPSCSNHTKASEPECIICGARLRSPDGAMGRSAGAVLMGLGLSLTACPTDDTSGDSMGSNTETNPTSSSSSSTSETSSSSATSTMSTTSQPATGSESGSSEGTATDPGMGSTTFAGESAYGVPGDSSGTTIGEEDTDSTTGPGTTSLSPDYGVPEN